MQVIGLSFLTELAAYAGLYLHINLFNTGALRTLVHFVSCNFEVVLDSQMSIP